jgi:DNA-directed RNA polymerase subunit RPC12/RpoP
MADEPKPELRRCPNCGASDLALNTDLGKIQCRHCKAIFDGKLADDDSEAEDLIDEDVLVTFHCSSCGAEVTLNANETLSAQCHWCRHIFSLNEKVLNGAVPDLVLPFKVKREVAMKKISDRITSMPRDYYDATFMSQFDIEKTTGVYFPYFVLDEEAHVTFRGVGQRSVHGIVSKDIIDTIMVKEARIEREFDLSVDDLTIESSSKRLKQESMVNTNNIINTILPFDLENAVEWDANYVRGFSCERRDTNVDDIDEIAELQIRDIARIQLRDTIQDYNRGVRWTEEHVEVKKTKWKTAYLPVWLYSYQDQKSKRIYYMAVNGRTGEMAGVMPLQKVQKVKKHNGDTSMFWSLIATGTFIVILFSLIDFWLICLLGFVLMGAGIVGLILSSRNAEEYEIRAENIGMRHGHERETRFEIKNLKKRDTDEVEIRIKSSPMIDGRNDSNIYGAISSQSVDMALKQNQKKGDYDW